MYANGKGSEQPPIQATYSGLFMFTEVINLFLLITDNISIFSTLDFWAQLFKANDVVS